MNFNETIEIIVESTVSDGCGGYVTNEVVHGEVKCKVAPYRVQIGDIIQIPNPTSSVKFFLRELPFDEDEPFIIVYKGKRYKKIVIADYSKVVMVIGERI